MRSQYNKKLAGNLTSTCEWLDDTLEKTNSQMATISLLGYLGFIALTVATLGLLGLVMYTVEVKGKEILRFLLYQQHCTRHSLSPSNRYAIMFSFELYSTFT